MIYCINPECKKRQNPENVEFCQSCGTQLLINERYRLLKPLRPLDPRYSTDIFEVDDRGVRKVMKILKDNHPQSIDRFEREALTLQLLKHPGLPKVKIDEYFSFTPNNSAQDLYCLVMEKIEGDNLEQWVVKNGVISQSLALKWLRQLIEILDLLHQNHLFHRDIKPSNIMITKDGKLVLIDFGSVREIENTYLAKINVGKVTAIISGGYTPPEQIEGKGIPQSDFYALGRTFVYFVTGKSPVELPNDPQTGKLIWQDKARQISKPLADFIDELMAFVPADRPQNTTVILRYLTYKMLLIKSILRFLNSPRFKYITLGILTLGIAGIGVYWWSLPLQAEALSNRGRKALMNENLDKARQDFQRAIELNPNNPIHHNDLGLVCELQKETECAYKQYRKALELQPDEETTAIIYSNLGFLEENKENYAMALQYYQIAMRNKGEIGVIATNNFARLQIWQNLEDFKAINLILNVLNKTKDGALQSTLYKNLGWAYLEQGRLEERKGRYQEAQKYLRQAENYLRESIRLDETRRAAPYCLLAQLLELQNVKENTVVFWQKCRDYESEKLPEVQEWQSEARRRLIRVIYSPQENLEGKDDYEKTTASLRLFNHTPSVS